MRISLAIGCLVLAAGCAAERHIAVAVSNTGTRDYDEVAVMSEEAGFRFTFGVLPPLARKTHHDALVTVPRRFHVTFLEGTESKQALLDVPPHDGPCVKCMVAIVFPAKGPPIAKIVMGNSFTSTVIPDASDPEFRRYRALATATYERNHQEAARLLEAGAPVFWDDPEIQSPLEWAAGLGDVLLLKSILGHVRDIPLPRLSNAFKVAAQDDHIDCLRELRTRVERLTPEVIQKALSAAVEHGHGPAVRYFVEEVGIPINTPVSGAGHTLLDLAVLSRKTDLASYLRGKGGLQVVTKPAA